MPDRTLGLQRFLQPGCQVRRRNGAVRLEFLDQDAPDLTVVDMDMARSRIKDRLDDVVDVALHRLAGKVAEDDGGVVLGGEMRIRQAGAAGRANVLLPRFPGTRGFLA